MSVTVILANFNVETLDRGRSIGVDGDALYVYSEPIYGNGEVVGIFPLAAIGGARLDEPRVADATHPPGSGLPDALNA